MKRILALDYGPRFLGVAFASTPLAEPIGSFTHQSLPDLIDQYQPQLLVVGLPRGPLANQVKAFAARLRRQTHLPVVLHPETLSTQEAIQKLRQIKAPRRKLKNNHPYAACLILEDYLESLKAV